MFLDIPYVIDGILYIEENPIPLDNCRLIDLQMLFPGLVEETQRPNGKFLSFETGECWVFFDPEEETTIFSQAIQLDFVLNKQVPLLKLFEFYEVEPIYFWGESVINGIAKKEISCIFNKCFFVVLDTEPV